MDFQSESARSTWSEATLKHKIMIRERRFLRWPRSDMLQRIPVYRCAKGLRFGMETWFEKKT